MVGRRMSEGYPFRPEVTQGAELLDGLRPRLPGNREPGLAAPSRGRDPGRRRPGGLRPHGGDARHLRCRPPERRAPSACAAIPVRIASPRDAVRAGICLLTEDRKGQGLMLDMGCAQNITITDLRGRDTSRPARRRAGRTPPPTELIDALSIRAQSPAQLVRFLSGGNQQKVVVAKWLFADAQILIFDEPTRGIDVGAKLEIYNLIWDLAAEGSGIIVVSSDLPELLGICHRIAVFSRGAIVGELDARRVQRASRAGAGVPELHRSGLDSRRPAGPGSDDQQGRWHERRRDTHRGRAPGRAGHATRQPGHPRLPARGRRGRGAHRHHARLRGRGARTSPRPTTSCGSWARSPSTPCWLWA